MRSAARRYRFRRLAALADRASTRNSGALVLEILRLAEEDPGPKPLVRFDRGSGQFRTKNEAVKANGRFSVHFVAARLAESQYFGVG